MNNQNISQEYDLFKKVGVVIGVADGIVSILGIANVAYGETVDILLVTPLSLVWF
jgi:F0F1-type ATP synthase alpha subunit